MFLGNNFPIQKVENTNRALLVYSDDCKSEREEENTFPLSQLNYSKIYVSKIIYLVVTVDISFLNIKPILVDENKETYNFQVL